MSVFGWFNNNYSNLLGRHPNIDSHLAYRNSLQSPSNNLLPSANEFLFTNHPKELFPATHTIHTPSLWFQLNFGLELLHSSIATQHLLTALSASSCTPTSMTTPKLCPVYLPTLLPPIYGTPDRISICREKMPSNFSEGVSVVPYYWIHR